MGTLPSRKHLGCVLVCFKIALSLETSSKNRRSMLILIQKNGDFAFKVVLLEGVVTELVAPLLKAKFAPVRDILKILGFACSMNHQKLCFRARQFDVFAFVIIFVPSTIALPCGASF